MSCCPNLEMEGILILILTLGDTAFNIKGLPQIILDNFGVIDVVIDTNNNKIKTDCGTK